MQHVKAIRKRLLDRARYYLKRQKTWAKHKESVQRICSAAARDLARSLPGCIDDYDIDHVVALSRWDLSTRSGVLGAFGPNNLQWLRSGTNKSKGAR